MDSKILAELVELRDAVQESRLKRMWEAEEQKAAETAYETRAKLLMEGAPKFFLELASHWEGMQAFNDGLRCGISVEDFTFAIFRLDNKVWYQVQGAITLQLPLELKSLDLTSGLPQLVVDCLGRHYRKSNIVTDAAS
jgi:hypothetical protein